MSEIKVNNIQGLEGTHGPVVSGITTMASSGAMLLPRGDTSYRGGRGRGVFWGGNNGSFQNVIQYITISTTGNALDFGDLTLAKHHVSGSASSTRALWGGGLQPTAVNTIDYNEIATQGNSIDFGDVTTQAKGMMGGCSNGHGGL